LVTAFFIVKSNAKTRHELAPQHALPTCTNASPHTTHIPHSPLPLASCFLHAALACLFNKPSILDPIRRCSFLSNTCIRGTCKREWCCCKTRNTDKTAVHRSRPNQTMDATPSKRRALASLDPNASPKPRLDLNQTKPTQSAGSPLKKKTLALASDTPPAPHALSSEEEEPKKRALAMDDARSEEQPSKRPCRESSKQPESGTAHDEPETSTQDAEVVRSARISHSVMPHLLCKRRDLGLPCGKGTGPIETVSS
jgi:hypothetical protein